MYYSDGHWLTHELTNGPIPVASQMGRILLCLPSRRPPVDANRHIKVIHDSDSVAQRRSIPKTPDRPRIASAPETPSSLIRNMKTVDIDQMVQAATLFEMEHTDDGESFWINSAPSQISPTPSPKKSAPESGAVKMRPTYSNAALWLRTPPSPRKHFKWPEMTEEVDDFMRPLQEHLIAAEALRHAQEVHGDWVKGTKFYELWWEYRVCKRKGLVHRHYGEPFKQAAKEVTPEDISYEKLQLV